MIGRRAMMGKSPSNPELVTNGTFDADEDWGKTSGWSISDGKAACAIGTTLQTLYQTINVTLGQSYQVSLDVAFGPGSVESLVISLASPSEIPYTEYNMRTILKSEGNGTYSFPLIADAQKIIIAAARSSTASLRFLGSVDNVSVRKVAEVA